MWYPPILISKKLIGDSPFFDLNSQKENHRYLLMTGGHSQQLRRVYSVVSRKYILEYTLKKVNII